jgi:hypothetical protein
VIENFGIRIADRGWIDRDRITPPLQGGVIHLWFYRVRFFLFIINKTIGEERRYWTWEKKRPEIRFQKKPGIILSRGLTERRR